MSPPTFSITFCALLLLSRIYTEKHMYLRKNTPNVTLAKSYFMENDVKQINGRL